MDFDSELLKDRVKLLQEISGLSVRVYKNKNESCFVFSNEYRTFKEAFTYKKAKMFAEGVRLGRNLALNKIEKCV